MAKTINELLEKFLPEILRGINRQSINQYPEVLSGETESSKNKFYYLVKGSTTGAVISSIKTMSGAEYPASLISFINDEIPDGAYFYLPFSQITLTSGALIAGKSDFK